MEKKYDKYKITSVPTTMEEICYPKDKKFELLPQQKFLAEYLHDNIENLPSKGLLVYHGIGSGKTCTAIRIAEKFKNNMKIVIVVPASLIGNFKDELRSACGNYLSE
jgi:superfamily II DNA or RNA helicase